MEQQSNKAKVLITDIDNTLFDWFLQWHSSYSVMINHIVNSTSVDRDILFDEIKRLHQQNNTAEYNFLLDSLPIAFSELSEFNNPSLLHDSLHLFKICREKNLKLFPTVFETLQSLKNNGVKIVGCTESQSLYTVNRLQKLGIMDLFDYLYASEDQSNFEGIPQLSYFPASEFPHGVNPSVLRNIPGELRKPDSAILEMIIDDIKEKKENCVYVGDSTKRDIAMAQSVGVYDVHAKYGYSVDRPEYELLVAITHWSDEEVEIEKSLNDASRPPMKILNNFFSEIAEIF